MTDLTIDTFKELAKRMDAVGKLPFLMKSKFCPEGTGFNFKYTDPLTNIKRDCIVINPKDAPDWIA